MKHLELEMWARQVCERVAKGQGVEDSRLELKAMWPDPQKAARRIAGHANMAKGENILWLVGVDEKNGVTGATAQEMSKWWPQVRACFHGEAPSLLHDLNFDVSGKGVTALYFDTSRFPFVVKNPDFGKRAGEFELETPWREGTAIRSATRGDLLLMLAPRLRVPKIEVLQGRVAWTEHPRTDQYSFVCTLEMYIVPQRGDCLTFPFHRFKAALEAAGQTISEDFTFNMGSWQSLADQNNMMMRGLADRYDKPPLPSENIQLTQDEVVIKGPGKVALLADCGGEHRNVPEMQLSLNFVEALAEMPVALVAKFIRTDSITIWDLVSCKSNSA